MKRMARPLSKTILIRLNARLGEPLEFCRDLSKALMRRKSAPVISVLRIKQVKSKVSKKAPLGIVKDNALTLKSTDLVRLTSQYNFYGLHAFLEKSIVLAISSSLVFATWTCKDIPHYNNMWKSGFFGLLAICMIVVEAIETHEEEETDRQGKVLPIFQVVRFPNDVCTGSTRNGTCFTA